MPLAFVAVALIFWSGLASASASQNGRIVFTSNRTGSWQIYTMNPDGSDQVQVTDLAPVTDEMRSAFPSISPDGPQIAFNYNGGDGSDLYVINVEGSGLRQLTSDHSSGFPRWSPDGKRLAFATASKLGTWVRWASTVWESAIPAIVLLGSPQSARSGCSCAYMGAFMSTGQGPCTAL